MSTNKDLLTLFNESEYYSLKYKNYFPVYERLFSRFKGKKITFVEIGVLSGGSLFMWRNYFGKDARIIGVELNPEAMNLKKMVLIRMASQMRIFGKVFLKKLKM